MADIVEASDAITTFISAISKEIFLNDDYCRSAVLHKLTIIGEAAANLPAAFREVHPSVQWRAMIGFRNVAVHKYFALDWTMVWVAASEQVPQLRRQIAAILDAEFGGDP